MSKALVWEDGRWHCDGRGIHAGDAMELRGHDKQWFPVRVESANQGRRLTAFVRIHEMEFARGIDTDFDELRWP